MARPTPTTPYQEELYDAVSPLAYDDANQGWDLLIYAGAVASMFDQIETYARDQADGTPGWGILLDIDRCPAEALPWLGQFVGVVVNTTLSVSDQRAQIRNVGGFKRGSLGAMIAAAAPYLTGNKTILVREREVSVSAVAGGAYGLQIVTYTSETPDSAKVLAALQSQKPGGIIMAYNTVAGATYLVIRTTYATYTAMRATFTTYNGLRNNQPGT